MQVVLVTFKADGQRRSFSLPRDVTVIGRREDCDLRIPLGEVSRKHCRFIKDGQTLRVEDLGSSNGTYHNAIRVQEAVVQPGDTVQVGPIGFVVQIDGVPADADIQPAVAPPDINHETALAGFDAPKADSVATYVGAGDQDVVDLDPFANIQDDAANNGQPTDDAIDLNADAPQPPAKKE